MLTCEEALERMSEALDGPLSLEDRQALDEHLESCPECRAAYEALFQMEDALREIGETPAPAELSAQVMARIRSEQTKSRRPIPLWKQARWRNLAGLAACAVLCVGLYYGADLGNPGTAIPEPAILSQVPQEDPDTSAQSSAGEAQDQPEPDTRAAQPEPAQASEQEEADSGIAAYSAPEADQEAAADDAPCAASAQADTRSLTGQAGTSASEGDASQNTTAEESPAVQETSPETPDSQISPPQDTDSTSQSEQEPDTIPSQDVEEDPGSDPSTQAPNNLDAVPTTLPPWGESTVWLLHALPQEAEALLPAAEDWTVEEDGTRWCTVTGQELESIQAALDEAGVEAELPEQPWTEACAVVLLPEDEPAADIPPAEQ